MGLDFRLDFRRMSTRLYLGFALPAIAIATIGGYGLYSFRLINQKVGTIYDDRVIPLEQLKRISDNYAVNVIDAVNKAHAGLITLQTAQRSIQAAQGEIDRTWQAYRSTQLTAEEAQLAAETETFFRQANSEIERLLQLLPTLAAADLAAFDGPLYRVIDPLTANLQELIELQLDVAEAERLAAQALYRQTRMVFLLLVLVALVLASPAGYLFSQVITKTLKETTDAVARALAEIAAATEEHERIAAQQASAVHETTATLDQLNSFAQASAQQAETVSQKSQRSLQLSETGAQSAQQTLASISDLQANVKAMAVQIQQLSDQASQIGSISSLVSDIANQTNMLSLNAAVEAVRAGDQGKGFAVVAGEIRKLADQSKQSSENISQLVADIQKSVQSTAAAATTGAHHAEDSVLVVQTSAATFGHVASANQEMVLSGQQISVSAEQQAKAIREVLQAMQSLNAAAAETTLSIAQTRQGAEQLNQTMNRLKALV
jgi:methyl-accepting chemotaxis protein